MSMRIDVTLSDELQRQLYAIATERNVSLAKVIRQLINEEYNSLDKENQDETEDNEPCSSKEH